MSFASGPEEPVPEEQVEEPPGKGILGNWREDGRFLIISDHVDSLIFHSFFATFLPLYLIFPFPLGTGVNNPGGDTCTAAQRSG